MPSSLTIVLSIALVFSTCPPASVWGTGTMLTNYEAFLGSIGSMTSPKTARYHVSGMWTADLPTARPTRLPQDNQRLGSSTFLRPLLAVRLASCGSPFGSPHYSVLELTRTWWYWNINQLCIDYAFRPRLSSRLTLGGLAFPRNPWAFGGGVSHSSLATHPNILTRMRSTTAYAAASLHIRRSPTPRINTKT